LRFVNRTLVKMAHKCCFSKVTTTKPASFPCQVSILPLSNSLAFACRRHSTAPFPSIFSSRAANARTQPSLLTRIFSHSSREDRTSKIPGENSRVLAHAVLELVHPLHIILWYMQLQTISLQSSSQHLMSIQSISVLGCTLQLDDGAWWSRIATRRRRRRITGT
jgi:hypothetical protein